MGDVGVLDYIGYAMFPQMMRMAQDRQDQIDKQRLGEFMNQSRAFDTSAPGQPNGMAIEHSGGRATAAQEIPDSVRQSYERMYGIPMPAGRMRGVEELSLRDAATKGRAGGVQAGEQAITGQRYTPELNDFRMGEIARILGQTGESPSDYDIAGSVAGLQRRQPKLGELPNTIEAMLARDPNMPLDEKIIKLGELSKLKQREAAAGQPRTLEALVVEQIRQGKSPEEALRIAERLAGAKRPEGETPQAKDMKRLEDDIMQTIGRLASIQSGQNMMDSAMASERPQVVQQLQTDLDGMMQEYQARGGNPARFGRQPPAPGQAKPMEEKPPAAQHKGKILRDTKTGKRYQSDGKNWVEIK